MQSNYHQKLKFNIKSAPKINHWEVFWLCSSCWLRVEWVLLFEVELKKELFCVRVPFRPEPILPFVNLTTWNLKQVFRVKIQLAMIQLIPKPRIFHNNSSLAYYHIPWSQWSHKVRQQRAGTATVCREAPPSVHRQTWSDDEEQLHQLSQGSQPAPRK